VTLGDDGAVALSEAPRGQQVEGLRRREG
jgi:hypothetical protein